MNTKINEWLIIGHIIGFNWKQIKWMNEWVNEWANTWLNEWVK